MDKKSAFILHFSADVIYLFFASLFFVHPAIQCILTEHPPCAIL